MRPDETPTHYRIRTRLGVTPAQARLLAKLYEGNGKAVSADDLLDACTGHWDVDPEILKVQISKLRSRIGYGAVRTVWAFGYQLSEEAAAQVRSAMG